MHPQVPPTGFGPPDLNPVRKWLRAGFGFGFRRLGFGAPRGGPDLECGGSGGVWKPTSVIFNYRSYRRATVATLCLPQPLSNEVGIDKKWKLLGLW